MNLKIKSIFIISTVVLSVVHPVFSWYCPGWKCMKAPPHCMQGCVDRCGCCVPCPYLQYGERCRPGWSHTGHYFTAEALCAPGLHCDSMYGVCMLKTPFYKPMYPDPFPFAKPSTKFPGTLFPSYG